MNERMAITLLEGVARVLASVDEEQSVADLEAVIAWLRLQTVRYAPKQETRSANTGH